jgi:hypothetical protein
MGHTRLGKLPRTRKWREVIDLIAAGADAVQVAEATLKVAEKAFSYKSVSEDDGFNEAVWLVTQLGLCAKTADPLQHLRDHGVDIGLSPTLPELMASMSESMDDAVDRGGVRSDLAELSHRALVHAVGTTLGPKLDGQLFGMSPEVFSGALADLRKPREFAQLSRSFFSRLTRECMDYYLSQTLNTHVGDGQRFASTNEKAQFDEALATHCREASKIVEQYSGDWFSKHRFQEDGSISRDSVRGFASWAMRKMTDELRAGAQADAE